MQRALLLATLVAILLGAEGANVDWIRTSPSEQEPNALFETHLAPATFRKLHQAPGNDHSMTLQIGLRNTRFEDSIDDLLERMSDPAHPKFRPHLNDKELAELSQPDDESIEAVVGWLKSHGFENHQINWTAHKDWISLEKVPLKKVEYMLDTTYSVYQHHDGEHLIRTEKYSLPRNLHQHIELIQVSIFVSYFRRYRGLETRN
jgi:tripeptidyl-peptidase-1